MVYQYMTTNMREKGKGKREKATGESQIPETLEPYNPITLLPTPNAPRPDLRETILDAVDSLLARYGYQKMTMDDIAREAGISKRTIYLRFTGKEEVALSSIDRVVERLLTELRSLAQADSPPDRRLHAMLRARVLFRFDSVQDIYRSFDAMFAALRPAYLARRALYFAAESSVFAEVLTEGVDQGVFSNSDPMLTAQTLIVATNALLPYSLSAQELGARDEIEARITRIADLLLNGVCARA
jgi:AcrR family transcriptional regulator